MIKVAINSSSRYPVDRKRLRKTVRDFLLSQAVDGDAEVGISFVGDRKMKELNSKYLKVKSTTDVLSFSGLDDEVKKPENESVFVEGGGGILYLGDLVVSFPQAVSQALERQITVDEEIDFLVQHGLLHLLGIHHD